MARNASLRKVAISEVRRFFEKTRTAFHNLANIDDEARWWYIKFISRRTSNNAYTFFCNKIPIQNNCAIWGVLCNWDAIFSQRNCRYRAYTKYLNTIPMTKANKNYIRASSGSSSILYLNESSIISCFILSKSHLKVIWKTVLIIEKKNITWYKKYQHCCWNSLYSEKKLCAQRANWFK